MRKLLLSLMVLASLVSCGKDNKVATATTAVAATAPVTNSITLDDATAKQLATVIDSSTTYFSARPASNLRLGYVTSTASTTSSGSNCEEKSGWFGIKYYVCKSSSSSSNVTPTSFVSVNSVDLETKKNELRAIVNRSSAGAIYYSGYAYTIKTTDGSLYTIDTRYPIEANPVVVQTAAGQITYYAGLFN
jgi:flagellar hook assembly protein FlgD